MNDGIEIGAMTTLTNVVRHPVILEKYGLLTQAAELVASPQIRNQGTLGGNVSQDARCWYYRAGWPCYRAGGNICYADTPVGRNREHAILDADRCVAVNPSDTAPALIAHRRQDRRRHAEGERVVDAENYFVGPDLDITRMTILRPGDLLTSIRIPATWANAQFYFEKVRDRTVWDFPLMNVASAVKLSGGTIQDIRIAVNAVAARRLRLKNVEASVRGKARTAATGEAAGKLAVQGAVPSCSSMPTRFRSCATWSSVPSGESRRRHGHPRVGDQSVRATGSYSYCLVSDLCCADGGPCVSGRACDLRSLLR